MLLGAPQWMTLEEEAVVGPNYEIPPIQVPLSTVASFLSRSNSSKQCAAQGPLLLAWELFLAENLECSDISAVEGADLILSEGCV